MKTRREALRDFGLVTAAALVVPATEALAQQSAQGPFTLPPLPYAFDALEPHIDAQTMQIHHDRHHAAYVNNLNNAVASHPDLKSKQVEEIVRDLSAVPESIRTAVRNNGGGHLNHSLFWQMMSKQGGGQPKGELAKAIDSKFGSYEKFQEQFTRTAMGVFGSGWAWLTLGSSGDLAIEGTPNQDSPVTAGKQPLLGVDVWEHAYYLKYQNRRPDYVKAFYNVINWDFVADRYNKIRKG